MQSSARSLGSSRAGRVAVHRRYIQGYGQQVLVSEKSKFEQTALDLYVQSEKVLGARLKRHNKAARKKGVYDLI